MDDEDIYADSVGSDGSGFLKKMLTLILTSCLILLTCYYWLCLIVHGLLVPWIIRFSLSKRFKCVGFSLDYPNFSLSFQLGSKSRLEITGTIGQISPGIHLSRFNIRVFLKNRDFRISKPPSIQKQKKSRLRSIFNALIGTWISEFLSARILMDDLNIKVLLELEDRTVLQRSSLDNDSYFNTQFGFLFEKPYLYCLKFEGLSLENPTGPRASFKCKNWYINFDESVKIFVSDIAIEALIPFEKYLLYVFKCYDQLPIERIDLKIGLPLRASVEVYGTLCSTTLLWLWIQSESRKPSGKKKIKPNVKLEICSGCTIELLDQKVFTKIRLGKFEFDNKIGSISSFWVTTDNKTCLKVISPILISLKTEDSAVFGEITVLDNPVQLRFMAGDIYYWYMIFNLVKKIAKWRYYLDDPDPQLCTNFQPQKNIIRLYIEHGVHFAVPQLSHILKSRNFNLAINKDIAICELESISLHNTNFERGSQAIAWGNKVRYAVPVTLEPIRISLESAQISGNNTDFTLKEVRSCYYSMLEAYMENHYLKKMQNTFSSFQFSRSRPPQDLIMGCENLVISENTSSQLVIEGLSYIKKYTDSRNQVRIFLRTVTVKRKFVALLNIGFLQNIRVDYRSNRNYEVQSCLEKELEIPFEFDGLNLPEEMRSGDTQIDDIQDLEIRTLRIRIKKISVTIPPPEDSSWITEMGKFLTGIHSGLPIYSYPDNLRQLSAKITR